MKCLILGGGAAGLMAACALARSGAGVTVLERQPRVGKKLLATGNGRCNMTNLRAAPGNYHGARDFTARVLDKYPPARVISEFDEMGLTAFADAEGRVYPGSNMASTVLDTLRLTLREAGGIERVDFDAVKLTRYGNGFCVVDKNGAREEGDAVLVAAGGMAAPKLGGGGSGYALLAALGHKVTPIYPAITPLTTETVPIRGLKGLRVRCDIVLMDGDKTIAGESGEALFTEYGVSGICVMQLSRAVLGLKSPRISMNLAPGMDEKTVFERARRLENRALEDFLNGLLPRKLGLSVLRAAGIGDMSRCAGGLSPREISAVYRNISAFSLKVTGVCGFDSAQVTAGGVDMSFFDPETMESHIVPGLYVAGEVCDVDGDCGGFNLNWAWASALCAADGIINRS